MDNTFSIVCRCERIGWMAVAVTTARPAVGNRVPWARVGVGAAASQADTNPDIARQALDGLELGLSPEQALEQALARDPGRDRRQAAVLDRHGRVAVYTGCEVLADNPWAGHITGEGYAIQGNLLIGKAVLLAMEQTFCNGRELPLPERALAALSAGQLAGGDKRGKVSAALLVVGEETHPLVDLRVDMDAAPVDKLAALYREYIRIFPLPHG